jgi:hypothetical protein
VTALAHLEGFMLSRRSRLAALLVMSVVLGSGCTGGPISDFPTSNHGNGDHEDDNGSGNNKDGQDAGESPTPGDGDDAAGDGDAENPGLPFDGGVPGDGGVPTDASTDGGDSSVADAGIDESEPEQ